MSLRHVLPLAAVSLAALPLFMRAAMADPKPQLTGPVVHENIAVFFVRGASAPGPVPMTLQEALAKGTVEVQETGNVQELKIENKGSEAVFVQFGDIVKGGQQDRVLTISMMLAPKSGLVPIGAYCVEQGRWSARGAEDVKRFAGSEAMMPSREAKIAMAKPKVAEPAVPRVGLGAGQPAEQRIVQQRRTAGGESADGQGEVWRSVGLVQQQLTANLAAPVVSEKSRTSLQLSLETEALQKAQATYIAALEAKGLDGDDIVGVVIAIDGRISSADMYPSNGLFRKMWPKLARAAATEALATKKKDASKPADAPAVADVEGFLKAAEAGQSSVRQLGSHARLETKTSAKAVHIETRTGSGDLVHRNFIAY
ncbi:MAG: ARPP-1 family domain-containing protein [Hyphomicrobiaceae bacterium]